jgi:hypothetical protein
MPCAIVFPQKCVVQIQIEILAKKIEELLEKNNVANVN